MTLAKLNKFLRDNGMPDAIELVKGKGYFYFTGGETVTWHTTTVLVTRSDALTPTEWLSEFNRLAQRNLQ